MTRTPVRDDAALDVADLARLEAVAADPLAHRAAEPVGHRLFPAMDRAVHRRPGWTAALAMASDRVAYYEHGNGENPRGWHTGAGMLSWWGTGAGAGGQYSDGFWATADPYRLPGTTVSRKPLADGAGAAWGGARPGVTWVGGATDGEFAMAGQHLKGLDSTMTARKSWLFLDDAIVCLGAGITGHDGVPVESVVDNRKLDATAALTVDGVPRPVPSEGRGSFPGARWAHVEGHGGYVFPGLPGAAADLMAVREARTGTWRAVNHAGSAAPVTRRYLTLWFDHGTDPADAGYAYVMMPGAGPGEVAERAAGAGWLRVAANTAAVQGAAVPALGVTAACFWAAGRAGALSATAPACVLIRERAGEAVLCLSGPDRTGTPFDLTWDRPVLGVVARDAGVRPLDAGSRLTLRVTPGTAGATLRAVVRTA